MHINITNLEPDDFISVGLALAGVYPVLTGEDAVDKVIIETELARLKTELPDMTFQFEVIRLPTKK